MIKPRSRAQPRLFLHAVKLGAGWVLGAKALPLEGWAPLPPSSSKEPAQVHNGAQVHLLQMQPWMGGWQDTQDCCQGDCAPRVSMATAPLDCSPSLPGCSCPGNPRALLAPAALGHPGFGGGGQCWQATVSQAAVLGLEGDDVPPPQGSGHHCCWAGGLLGAKVPLQGCPQDSQPDMRPQRTQ